VLTKIATGLDFVVAKTRAMRSQLYEGDRLRGLLRLRELPELARALLPMETFASHTALERRLVERFAESLAQLWRYLAPPRDRLFVAMALRLQVENLKVILRGTLSGRRTPVAELPTVPLPEPFAWTGFPPSGADGPGDILRSVPEPALRRSAGEALILFAETPIPLYLEAGLDRGYFQLLAEAWRALSAEDRRAIGGLLDREIGLYNLMFVLRARVSHGIDPASVLRLAAPRVDGAQSSWVTRAVSGASVEDILAHAPQGLRRILDGATRELPDIERRLWLGYYRAANRVYYRTFFNIGCPYAYAAARRIELANLITVVESVRYGLSVEETLRRLLRLEAP
jgi:vacuolar-type H+-ATPase subunit C/Vma6